MKLTKAQLRTAASVKERLDQPTLTPDDAIYVMENYHEGTSCDVAGAAAHFTPPDMAYDHALFVHKSGCHIVDISAGIGMLSFACMIRNYYGPPIKSVTLLELNPTYVEIGKRVVGALSAYNESHSVIDINWIQGNVFDQQVWLSATTLVPGGIWDSAISNPPFGNMSKEDRQLATPWMNYTGKRDIACIELAMRYTKGGYYILPPGSVDFRYSGARYFERVPCKELDRLRKANPDRFLATEATSVDGSYYRDQWRATTITTESVELNFNREEYY